MGRSVNGPNLLTANMCHGAGGRLSAKGCLLVTYCCVAFVMNKLKRKAA
jgi:hypothetical protein